MSVCSTAEAVPVHNDSRNTLGFDAHVADPADEVIGGGLAFFHSHDFDGISLVVRPKNQMIAGRFHILDRTALVLEDGVHVELALAIRLE
jgi:hypothetical protein